MEIPHRDLATAQSARLVLSNLPKHLFCRSTPRKQLVEAIIPVFGIRWDIHVIRRVGAKRLIGIAIAPRNSAIPTADYNRSIEIWKSGLAEESISPTSRGPWRSHIVRFNLNGEWPLPTWLTIVDTCIKQGWAGPAHLARTDYSSFAAVALKRRFGPMAHQLWKAAAIVLSDASSGVIFALKGGIGRRWGAYPESETRQSGERCR